MPRILAILYKICYKNIENCQSGKYGMICMEARGPYSAHAACTDASEMESSS